MSAHLILRLFGPPDVQVNGRPLPRLKTRKGLWLLALLTLRHDREVSREWLAGMLWPDTEESQARTYLRQTLTDLRSTLGEAAECLRSPSSRTLALDLTDADVDLLTFDTCLVRGDADSLERAVVIYRGPLLEGCTEEWVLAEREARAQSYLGALETLSTRAMEATDPHAAVRYLRRVIAADAVRESAYRALMQALSDCRDYAAVIEAYRDLRLVLRRELNVGPDSETRQLFATIRIGARSQAETIARHDVAVVTGPVSSGASSPASNSLRRLPRPLSTFIGREQEVEGVVQALAVSRLVTLTGIGGVGKTRLAIRVVEEVAVEYQDGGWFVDLSPLSDPTLIPQTVAGVLEVPEQKGRPLSEALFAALRSQHLLLVLDNCEHLLPECTKMAAALLQECPHLQVLATSRQRLGITGEVERRVLPLILPDRERLAGEPGLTEEALRANEAVRLFLGRALLVQPELRQDGSALRAAAQICHRLDGIPLALELAAARMSALGPEQLAARIEERFRLLVGGDRTAPVRQQTLRALLDWSYDLLSQEEQVLFQRLSVFVGGWTLEATEAVCGCVGEWEYGIENHTHTSIHPHTHTDVLDILTSLVDKSLVLAEPDGEGGFRYRLLETVRQYARERLARSGEETARRARHRDYFLAFAEESYRYLSGPEQAVWLDRLEREHDNLRTALDWCLQEPAGIESGMQLAGALQKFWSMRGYVAEGARHLAAALSRDSKATPTAARGAALLGAGRLADRMGSYAAARDYLQQALQIERTRGDRSAEGTALANLGSVAYDQGNYKEARTLFEQALSILAEADDRVGEAHCLAGLGNVTLQQGDPTAARAFYSRALVLSRESGHRSMQAIYLNALGMVAERQQEDATARDYFVQSLALHREIGDRTQEVINLNNLGNVTRKMGGNEEARVLYAEALRLIRRHGEGRNRRVLAFLLEGIALPLLALGQPERAVRLLSVSDQLRESIGAPRAPQDQGEYQRLRADLETAMSADVFFSAWETGQRMTLEEAIDDSLGEEVPQSRHFAR